MLFGCVGDSICVVSVVGMVNVMWLCLCFVLVVGWVNGRVCCRWMLVWFLVWVGYCCCCYLV